MKNKKKKVVDIQNLLRKQGLPKVLRLRHSKKDKKEFAIEMRKANKDAKKIQKEETESIKSRRAKRQKQYENL